MQKLIALVALCIASTIFADLGRAQPVPGGPTTGGPTTGGVSTDGNAPTGGNTTGGNTTGGNVTGGNVGVNLGEERRFTVTFKTFKVHDETGCDLCGSDEVRFIIRTSDYALLSSEYEADSQLFYDFDRCAQPAVDGDGGYNHNWQCDPGGKAAPLSFTVAAWEDDGDPIFTGFCSENLREADGDFFPPTEPFCVEGRGELIGKKKVELTLEDLSELQVGQFTYKDIRLIDGCDQTAAGTCSGSGAPHYSIRYEIKRLPDASGGLPVNPNP